MESGEHTSQRSAPLIPRMGRMEQVRRRTVKSQRIRPRMQTRTKIATVTTAAVKTAATNRLLTMILLHLMDLSTVTTDD